jgi:hypothetical protein
MKHTALLLLGLALLPHAVQADQTGVPVCVEALEQLETLQTFAPVYKLTGGQERQYLADAHRPAEVTRLKTIVAVPLGQIIMLATGDGRLRSYPGIASFDFTVDGAPHAYSHSSRVCCRH